MNRYHKPTQLLHHLFLMLVFVLYALEFASAKTTDDASLINSGQEKNQAYLYRQTLSAIYKGHKSTIKQGMRELKNYPLYPYLIKAELTKRLKRLPYHDVDQFLLNYQGTVAATQLHKRWLKILANKQRWSDYIRYYRTDIANNELRCWYLEGLHQTGHTNIALEQTNDIWLNGKSMPDACNPLFKRWQQAGRQTDALVWQRTKLALSNNNSLLARYLSKRASAELKPYTRRLINVHRKPQRLSNHSDFTSNDPYSIDIISHGLKRLAAKDAELATRLWVDYRGFIVFSNHQYSDIRNKIARQIIASGNDNALDWLIVHDPNSEDSYLLEWRIRLALKKQHWNQAQHWISILPDKLQQQPRWQYWLARTHQQSHDKQALAMLEQLASERHYYGFLAADALNKDYDFNHSDLASTQLEQHIAAEPDIQRAHAFLTLGEFAPARREWLAAINRFDQQQLIAATNLAHHWGWHQQAIHTTIKAQQWNDLSIRFPLAFQTNMTDSAKSTTIRLEWLYAIARQESAFAQDAQSAAGARGLLQLKPRTAKQVARKMGIKYRSRDLLQADKNIVLGSHYLKQLLDDFEGNHILATAAYNAGPYRLKKWLKQQQTTLPYDIWIETLPFQETRNYVQNVLAFSVIYGHRLGLNSPLISQTELFIGK